MQGPHLRGCFKGDHVAVCSRPEELILRTQAGENRVRGDLRHTLERTQSIQANFGNGLIVDVPREIWRSLEDAGKRTGWWIEIPAHSLRQQRTNAFR